MEIISSPRQAGKTTRCMHWLTQSPDHILVTFSEREAIRLRKVAKDFHLDISDVQIVSYDDNLRTRLRGFSDPHIAVDNADMVLASVLGRIPTIITVTGT